MQQLKIPQSPIVTPQGLITQEWLVFINELMRLNNKVISSGTIEQGENAAILGIGQASIATYNDDNASVYVALPDTPSETVENVAVAMQTDEQPQDNPYALMSAIEKQLYDQQIWGLNV